MTCKSGVTVNMSFQPSFHQKQGGKGNIKDNPTTETDF